jgi:hypothetical protein
MDEMDEMDKMDVGFLKIMRLYLQKISLIFLRMKKINDIFVI